MAVVQRLASTLHSRRLARRRREGEPAAFARWCLRHPVLVTAMAAASVAAGLFVVFRALAVPILVVLLALAAGLHRVLVAERRVYEDWRTGRADPGAG